MSDQEQRDEEHREYLSHKHRPATLDCDQCTKLMPMQTMTENYRDTGWNVCEFCIDDIPDFAQELIECLDKRIEELEAQL